VLLNKEADTTLLHLPNKFPNNREGWNDNQILTNNNLKKHKQHLII